MGGRVCFPTRRLVLLCRHGPGVELPQLPVQLLQLAAGGLELALHLGGALAVGDGPPHPLCCLLDLQLPLDLLPQLTASIFQTLLKVRVQDVPLLQVAQVTALMNTPQLISRWREVMLKQSRVRRPWLQASCSG